ncbi:MAG TPA: type II secretion system protein [Vicinamibacterales bacterium]|nr:type II secretion system protein [Vicinamibacterales bacterium]
MFDRRPAADEAGFTMIEALIAGGVILVLVAMAVPGLLRARLTANEVGAIASLRVTAAAQKAYAAACGEGRYAATFVVLGTRGPAGAPPFISDDFGLVVAPVRTGYAFTLGPGQDATPGPPDCGGTATVSTYYASAVPLTIGRTGTHSFAVNGRSVIWERAGDVAPAEPFGTPARPID